VEKIDFKNLDNKSKMEIAITSVMVIALVIILFNSAKTLFRSKNPAVPEAIAPAVFEDAAKRKDGPALSKIDKARKASSRSADEIAGDGGEWGRDPFAIRSDSPSSDATISGLKLEGIICDEKESYAIINGEVVKEGGKVGGNTVVRIEKKAVIVNDGTKDYNLRFWQ